METAGVVLGAVPLILYALDNYQRAWSPVKDIWNWNETIETIRNQVFLQKQQLATTLRTLGPGLADDTTMAEVEAILQISHPRQWEQFMHIIRQMNDLMNEIAKSLYPDAEGPPNWSNAKSDRMSWEWRRVKRSFGRKERKEIFSHLQTWNTALQNCGLEKREALPDTENRIINVIRTRFDENRTTTIRENVRALHKAISSGLGCTCIDAHGGTIQLNWHDKKPFTDSAFYIAISSKERTSQKLSGEIDPCWRTLSVQIEQSSFSHNTAPSDSSLTLSSLSLVATPDLNPEKDSTMGSRPKKMGVRILGLPLSRDSFKRSKSMSGRSSPGSTPLVIPKSTTPMPRMHLCSMLQSTSSHEEDAYECFPITEFESSKRLRILSMEPLSNTGPSSMKRTIRLHTLLARVIDQATNKRLALNRKQRFGIAAALAWAVLHLCDSPWLKEALDNEDIHFFLTQKNDTTSFQLSDHPYILSNLTSASKTTHSSAHDNNQDLHFQNKQIQNITLYTLAIRLIELGLNKPFAKVRQEYQNHSNTDTESTLDDYDIAQHQITELILDVGTSYGHAVDRCLRFLFPGPASMNTFEHRSFRSAFFADVVAPIQTTFELVPGNCAQIVL